MTRIRVPYLRRGLEGGFIATGVMTVYRLPVFRVLPPTAEFWARYVGTREAEAYLVQGVLLHFLYGTVAGVLFAPLFSHLTTKTPVAREYVGVAAGLGYGLLMSVFGTRVLFPYVIEQDLDADEALIFHVGHAIYGLTLGTWVGAHERVGEVYDDGEDVGDRSAGSSSAGNDGATKGAGSSGEESSDGQLGFSVGIGLLSAFTAVRSRFGNENGG